MALVALSVVEQRLDAVRAVLAGASVTEVAAGVGVSRQSVHAWLGRYLSEGVAGLADRSHRPKGCPHQVAEAVEVRVVELRREHPRWGAKRIRLELLRRPRPGRASRWRWCRRRRRSTGSCGTGLVRARPRKRPRESFKRFERPGPMQLWGIDIVGGIRLVDVATGEVREAKIVTGVDDHSRFCVIAKVVERATGRAVCLAFAAGAGPVRGAGGGDHRQRQAVHRPVQPLWPDAGEVLFDKICRRNGITHRLTAPASPNQNGKVERFHGTFRPEISEVARSRRCWRRRPRWTPGSRTTTPSVRTRPSTKDAGGASGQVHSRSAAEGSTPAAAPWSGCGATGPAIAVSPATAPARSRRTGRGWRLLGRSSSKGGAGVGEHVVVREPVLVGSGAGGSGGAVLDRLRVGAPVDRGQRVKSLRSRFSVTDLEAWWRREPGRPPSRRRWLTGGPGSRSSRTVFEVERTVARNGTVSLGRRTVCWPRRSSPAAGSGSISRRAARCCSSTRSA